MNSLPERDGPCGFVAAQVSSKWPHRLAVATAGATLPLLFIGGLVTGKGAGLAVPDWPTTFGYNMFLYPWSKMVGGIFYEHSHRLVASAIGLLTIFLALAFWLKEERRWLRLLALGALALVIVQGVLGGLRVVLLEHGLAIVHAAVAQAFFALVVSLAVFTSGQWAERPARPLAAGDRLRRLCASTAAFIYFQSVLGAVLRHTGGRADLHLLFAAVVAAHGILVLRRLLRFHADRPELVRPGIALGTLLALQLALGGAVYFGKFTTLLRWPADLVVVLATLHLLVGALMLGTSLILTLRCYRLTVFRPLGHGPELAAERAPA
ncbi:MAG TPA: COX15/CtaA family protein [candidate division Zixibacteria bacterium]|nr:COX15/CtaA family protein [candidate division Zixibacteria bacterium]